MTSQVLEKHLKAGDAGIQSALEEYSSGRLADVHALAYLDAISQHVRPTPLPIRSPLSADHTCHFLFTDGTLSPSSCRSRLLCFCSLKTSRHF